MTDCFDPSAAILEQAILEDVLHSAEALPALARCGWLRDQASEAAAATGADADEASWLAGTDHLLGLTAEELQATAPSQADLQAAASAAAPQVGAELARRCQAVAAAAHYGSADCRNLPDHLHMLAAAADRATQRESMGRALRLAQEVAEQLQQAGALLAALLQRHKASGQAEADEAQAALLATHCAALHAELRASAGRLLRVTYTPATLPALCAVSVHVERAVGEVDAQLREAKARLAAYEALGPSFLGLAAAHTELQRSVAELEYEVGEVERFAQLGSGGSGAQVLP